MVTLLAFLFVFSLVVVVHELGHFLAARAFGIRVDRFSIGFGKVIVSVRDRLGTEWALSVIPLGGYVKFFGDASAASTPDSERLAELKAEIESEHGRAVLESCYHFKPVWQRSVVAAAGPIANFVLAFVIFVAAVAITGDRGFLPIVGAVGSGSPAEAAGFAKGDRVVRIGEREIRYYRDVQQFAALSAGDETRMTVERQGELVELDLTVGRRVSEDPFGGESEIGYIGLILGLQPVIAAPAEGSPAMAAGFEAGDRIVAVGETPVDYFIDLQLFLEGAEPGPVEVSVLREGRRVVLEPLLERRTFEELEVTYLGVVPDASREFIVERYGPLGVISRGAAWTYEAGAAPVRYVARTLTGRESGRELGGVLRIGKVAGSMAEQAYDAGADQGPVAGFLSALLALVTLAGALSVAIGLLNLLPIPILDGGHLVYYAYEAVAGRPLGEGAQEWGFRIGLALVLGLMIFATWNDLRYLRVFEAIGNIFS